MTTSSKELSAEFNNVSGTIAEIRDDYRLPCPNGYVCEGVKQASCENVRTMFNDTERLGLGDIMAGIWCPRDNNTIRNCPIGNYCPDSKTVIPCPRVRQAKAGSVILRKEKQLIDPFDTMKN